MRIRPAVPDDAEAIARVQVETWRSTYRGLVSDRFLENLTVDERAERHRKRIERPEGREFEIVAVEDDVIGFAVGGPVRDDVPDFDSELYAIYVHEPHQGKGVGGNLIRAVAERLRGKGFESMLVWVLRDNPWRRFYEKMGGQAVKERPFTIGESVLPEVGYGWKDIATLCGDRPNE